MHVKGMMTAHTERSPSGLFRMSVWENDMERTYTQMPAWYWNHAERRWHFARWVEMEASGMAMLLARHLRSDTPLETAGPTRRMLDLLMHDAHWAQRATEQPAAQQPPAPSGRTAAWRQEKS